MTTDRFEDRYEQSTAMPVDEALRAVGSAAELWGAGWSPDTDGGRIELPVNSGIRAGLLGGRLEVRPRGAGSRITLDIESERYELHRQALAILIVGAVSGVVLMLWPFFPILLGFAPVAFVLALIAWFLVVSRLRMTGPREFLASVVEHEEPPEERSSIDEPATEPR